MRYYEALIAAVCMAIMTLLILISCALDKPDEPEPPKVDTKGLCVVEVKEPEYEMYFTEADVTALAQMLYGEARGCTVALDVLTRWSMEKQGADVARELPSTHLWFTGNGSENVFRGVY